MSQAAEVASEMYGPLVSIEPSGLVIVKVKPVHRSPPVPPAVGGTLSSQKTKKTGWSTPTGQVKLLYTRRLEFATRGHEHRLKVQLRWQ